MAERSSLATAANIFAAPNEAFQSIKDRPTFLLPLAALLLGYSLVSLLYMNSVDLPWYIGQQLESSDAQMTNASVNRQSRRQARSRHWRSARPGPPYRR
jgi:hypothetical protein